MIRHNEESCLRYAADRLVKDVLLIKEGENVVITADASSDQDVIRALRNSIESTQAIPILIIYSLPEEEDMPASISQAILSSDVWIELAENYALYSQTRSMAMNNGIRYTTLTGVTKELLVRALGSVDYDSLLKAGEKLLEIIKHAQTFAVYSDLGTDFRGRCQNMYLKLAGEPATKKGSTTMLIGTVNWICSEETLSGTLVIDGSIWPPHQLGMLRSPVVLTVKGGIVVEIEGKRDAMIFKSWLDKLADSNMYRVAHLTIGYHPNITNFAGKALQDERVYGSFQIGLGAQGPAFGAKWTAKGHTDAVIKSPTIIFDDNPLIKDGEFTNDELRKALTEAVR